MQLIAVPILLSSEGVQQVVGCKKVTVVGVRDRLTQTRQTIGCFFLFSMKLSFTVDNQLLSRYGVRTPATPSKKDTTFLP